MNQISDDLFHALVIYLKAEKKSTDEKKKDIFREKSVQKGPVDVPSLSFSLSFIRLYT